MKHIPLVDMTKLNMTKFKKEAGLIHVGFDHEGEKLWLGTDESWRLSEELEENEK